MVLPMGGLGPGNCRNFSTFLKIYMELLERKALDRVIWRGGKGEKVHAGGWLSKP